MFKLGEYVYVMQNNNIVQHRIAKVEERQPILNGPITRNYFYFDQSSSWKIMSAKSMFYSKEELVMETFDIKIDFKVGE